VIGGRPSFEAGVALCLFVPKAQDEADKILGVSATAYPAITNCMMDFQPSFCRHSVHRETFAIASPF
jgi:hypothetical protein